MILMLDPGLFFIFDNAKLLSDMEILINYGNPELKMIYFSYFSHNMYIWLTFFQICLRNPQLHFLVLSIQGIHISDGYKYTICSLLPDDGQLIN